MLLYLAASKNWLSSSLRIEQEGYVLQPLYLCNLGYAGKSKGTKPERKLFDVYSLRR